ncbi:T-cell surface glycoprotein CD3 epsilon chain [Anolis carolinensis]|nr:PREDICTED: T-cell surface glycoprotein CD3 epsilon chain [Anolis carolinensis]|eukprot:XP_008121077.1 PREDICTED: T-cell surface glycoprotein CD3 epsilon chain [Anolis carolinensis]
MRRGALVAALLALLSGPACSSVANEIRVDVWKGTVTLSCPTDATIQCSNQKEHRNPLILTDIVERREECTCGSSKLFLKVKVCQDCVELGLGLLAGIIVSDLLLTLGVLCLVYFCCKNRKARFRGGDGVGAARGRPPGPKADHPPPVPNPDYEPIRKGQREVYAGLGGRAF